MDDNQIRILLKKISAVSDEYDSNYRKTGRYFNIFDIANISSNEITICRIIHELLNPKGSHFQGDAYLRLFVDILKLKVPAFEFNDEEYHTVSVRREECITENRNRRIDLVIETETSYIPIEVKIYAGDQNEQCKDYYKKAKSTNNKKATMFYLTLYGSPPSSESLRGLDPDDQKRIKLISFKYEILNWLEKCLEHHETIKIAPIREILSQLKDVIRRLTNQMEEGQIMEISNILAESKINMKAAIDIEKGLIEAKKTMINKVFKAISEKIEAEGLFLKTERRNENKYDYEYNGSNPVNKYDDQKKSSYPGISYKCKSLDKVKAGVELWFRVEIDYKFFAGFCTPSDNGKSEKQLLEEQDLQNMLKKFTIDPNSWWVHWEYLPDKDSAPNFKDCNEQYLDLFDPEKFDDFINKSMDKIREMAKNLF